MIHVKYIVLDVDGTLTDGGIYYTSDGQEMKRFCVQDGAGIILAREAGISFIILTGRESSAVTRRAADLKIEFVFQGIHNKHDFLQKFMLERNIEKSDIAYAGDDINDFQAMKLCGFKACPADAAREIRELCDYASPRGGGHGAVRDICEYILKSQGKYGDFSSLFGKK